MSKIRDVKSFAIEMYNALRREDKSYQSDNTGFHIPPSIFKECESSGDTYNDWYQCCIDKCKEPEKWCLQHCKEAHDNSEECLQACRLNQGVCRFTCEGVWPFARVDNPYYQCAVKSNCFSNGFEEACLKKNKKKIEECCVLNCDPNINNFDCARFCKQHQAVAYK